MRHILFPFAVAALTSGAALAEPCPETAELSGELLPLIMEIQAAQSEREARQISGRMWALWAMAPNEQAQAILDRGMTRFQAYDYVGATADFDALIMYCPDYAEGYNQRAFVNYLRQDYTTALGDLDQAIALSPHHIGAMSGRALTLLGLGRKGEAREALQAAVALNPWLTERRLADPGGPLEPPGKEL